MHNKPRPPAIYNFHSHVVYLPVRSLAGLQQQTFATCIQYLRDMQHTHRAHPQLAHSISLTAYRSPHTTRSTALTQHSVHTHTHTHPHPHPHSLPLQHTIPESLYLPTFVACIQSIHLLLHVLLPTNQLEIVRSSHPILSTTTTLGVHHIVKLAEHT